MCENAIVYKKECNRKNSFRKKLIVFRVRSAKNNSTKINAAKINSSRVTAITDFISGLWMISHEHAELAKNIWLNSAEPQNIPSMFLNFELFAASIFVCKKRVIAGVRPYTYVTLFDVQNAR